jgi:hypothetical protein
MLLANLSRADLKRIARTVAGIVEPSLALPDPAQSAEDPDPARSGRVHDALRAWSEAATSPAMTDGLARVRDTSPRTSWYRQRVKAALAAQTSFHYVGEDDVRGRGIERFGSPVATILYLGLASAGETDRVIAYLDPAGAVAALSAQGF